MKVAMKGMKTGAMKAAMKGMKTGAMKTSMKKVMKVSKIARGKRSKSAVFRGSKEKTISGLTKDKLMRNKSGKVVSKARSALQKKAYKGSKFEAWIKAVVA